MTTTSPAARQSLLARVTPGLDVLMHYQRRWLRGDLLAGITVAAYAIPQVMAYSSVAGVKAVVGLWACLAPFVVYAIFGSSRQLSVGPESTTALMTGVSVGALAASGSGDYAGVAAAMAVAVGLVCLLGYVLRAGFLAALLSRPVLEGYMVGVAVLMIVSQLGRISRLSVQGERPDQEVRYWVSHLAQAHVPTLILAAAVLVSLFVIAHWWPRSPAPLIVMVAAAVAVAVFQLNGQGVQTIDRIPQGLPRPTWPRFGDDFWRLLPGAFGIALVGFSDNVLTGRVFAAKRHERIDANQELLALGLANVAGGLTQGFPISSSGSRTVLGHAMGSRTQLHSLVVAAITMLALLFFGPALSSFPRAALGAVVVYAALRLIDIAQWRRIAQFRKSELVLAALTTIAVLAFGVLNGTGIAIALSLLDLLRRLAAPHDGILGLVPGLAGMHDVDDYADARQIPGLVVYRYDSPLFFANAENFARRAMAAVDGSPSRVRWFLLNAEANVEVDLTAVDELDLLRERLESRGIEFAMARVKQDLFDQLDAAGFVDKVGRDRIFPTMPTAVAAYEQWAADVGPDATAHPVQDSQAGDS